ncbi:MAG TPA: aldehyde dehydrogenase family protein, partial [Sorangium sp.]|nr:aldehyde dehydrogenase family protein [Sorangium sp.]
MSRLSDSQIDAIARGVLDRIGRGGGGGSGVISPAGARAVARGGALPHGVFRSIDECVAAANVAFQALDELGLNKRKEIIQNVRRRLLEKADELAAEAHAETGLGRVDSKILKNRLVINKTPGPEELDPIAWTGDKGLTLVERAPFGVIAAITPTTNPTSTIICNSIGMLSAGNTVVFNVHPAAKVVSCRNVGIINEAVMEAGGPPNTVCA